MNRWWRLGLAWWSLGNGRLQRHSAAFCRAGHRRGGCQESGARMIDEKVKEHGRASGGKRGSRAADQRDGSRLLGIQ